VVAVDDNQIPLAAAQGAVLKINPRQEGTP
jgi:hypothetical protein